MKKYQAVLKFYGADGLTKTIPVGVWQYSYELAFEDLQKAVVIPDHYKKEDSWRSCGNDIRIRN